MDINSISLGYSQEEDRLLLQVISSDYVHQYWVSRRAALMLAEAIQNILTKQYNLLSMTNGSTNYSSDLAAFGHEAALEKLPSASSSESTLANLTSPLLIYQVNYTAIDANLAQLALMDKSNCGFIYHLTRDLLHTLLNLLESQCTQAAWGTRTFITFNHKTNASSESPALH